MNVKLRAYIIDSQISAAITDTATAINLNGVDNEVHNAGENTIYIGDATVSDASYELTAGDRAYIQNNFYAICASGETSTLKAIQVK